MKRLLLIFVLIISFFNDINAQFLKGKLAGLPVVFYSPDTRLGYGLVGVHTFDFSANDSLSNPSQMQLLFSYTQNKQLLFYVPFNIFLNNNAYNFKGEIGYYDYVFYYFGIGSNAGNMSNEELYAVKFPRIRLDVLKKVSDYDFLGLKYAYDNFNITDLHVDGALINSNISGTTGGRISGLGFVYRKDKRNSVFWPSKGLLWESYIQVFGAAFASDYSYQLFGTEFNYYKSFGKHILATQAFAHGSNGDVPFYQLPGIGGSKRLRGYYQDQFRDQYITGMQVEYRSPTVLNERLGFTAFLGLASQLGIDNTSFDIMRYSYGAGTRIRINKEDKVHIRIDYGFGQNNTGLYLTIGEAF